MDRNPRPRLPVTPDIMRLILRFLPISRDGSMIWAACCLAFFGFLRAGEITVPSRDAYSDTAHLSLADVALDSRCSEGLRAGGINEELYSGHSFRIGAATTAAKKGIED